jgi:hypothetical protein
MKAAGGDCCLSVAQSVAALSRSSLHCKTNNVPFTTALLTHGAEILFLLWHGMPRAVFEKGRTGGILDQAQAKRNVETSYPAPQDSRRT